MAEIKKTVEIRLNTDVNLKKIQGINQKRK